MKALTKSQLKKIGMMHAGSVLLATESAWAFENSDLSSDEVDYLDKVFQTIAKGLLDGSPAISDSAQIVEYIRKNYK